MTSGLDELSDADLVRRTLAGEPDAYEHLFLRHERAIFLYLRRICHVPEDAEDLTQETFLRALRGLRGYRLERPFRPWLFAIATNTARSVWRRRGPILVSLDAGASGVEGTATDVCRREELEQLKQAVAALGGEEAALIHLFYFEGMKLEAIGEVLGRRTGTVAVALHRVRQKLRKALSAQATEEGKEWPRHDMRPGRASL